jgi:hypothetical protein
LETILFVIEWGALLIGSLMGIYIIGRLISLSVFKSWYDAKKDSEKPKSRRKL